MDHSIAEVLRQTEEVISMVYEYVGVVARAPTQKTHIVVDPWNLLRELHSLRHILTTGFPLEALKDFSDEDEIRLEFRLAQLGELLRKLQLDPKLRAIENPSLPLGGNVGLLLREVLRIKNTLVLNFHFDDT